MSEFDKTICRFQEAVRLHFPMTTAYNIKRIANELRILSNELERVARIPRPRTMCLEYRDVVKICNDSIRAICGHEKPKKRAAVDIVSHNSAAVD